ncbi:hypothetical protein [Streptomyces tateyamensis]|uniref:hypothetical protein n=1 Tax=Streptomyces tateyamensis TaxID=565073 RepID=UPI0011B757F9|nr:hypothetical protein [Streptomyces tateyamensis]
MGDGTEEYLSDHFGIAAELRIGPPVLRAAGQARDESSPPRSEVGEEGFTVSPGDLGESITTV